MGQRIKMRHDTAANWSSANPVLAVGEWGYETDQKRLKIGDGVTAWNQIAYCVVNPAYGQTIMQGAANQKIFAVSSNKVVAHNLGRVPDGFIITLTLNVGGAIPSGYSVGDVIVLGYTSVVTVSADGTNTTISCSSANSLTIVPKAGALGVSVNLTGHTITAKPYIFV